MTTTNTHTNEAAPLPLVAGHWELDHPHSLVGFSIRHLGVAKVRGRFSSFDADVVIGNAPADCSVVATVDLASVDTGEPDRDAHIQAEDILDVARRPSMTFRSKALTGSEERWTLTGDLTIGDTTRPLTLDVEFGGVAEFPIDGTRHAGFTATGEIRRSDFDIAPGFPAPLLGDIVRIELDLELIEPSD